MANPAPLAAVARHWYAGEPDSLLPLVDAALVASGLDPADLSPDDLAGVDQFHMRGREATAELAARAGFTGADHVIDVGAGLGGPARFLARQTGCRVTGIDLTEEYCRVASELTRRLGMEDVVRFRQGDALALPFDDATFDGAWTQHISMNIPDKRAFFAEMARVVKPRGRVAIHDPIAGDGAGDGAGTDGPLTLPVPWARTPDMSHLVDEAGTRAALADAGLEVLEWHDVTTTAVEWFEARLKAGPGPLGLHVLLGADWPTMAANLRENLASGRVRAVQIVARRS
jgi:MPBQ/MSBQ methyltransferase